MAAKKLRENWDIFLIIADPTRRRILDLLKNRGPIRTSYLALEFPDISRPAISKHLRILHEYNLVESQWIGRECYYSLSARPLQEIKRWLSGYESFWSSKLAKLKRLSES